MIHFYYGYGKGKTTSAIGAGVRGCGAGLRVALVQFFKDNTSSELKALLFDAFKAPESLPFNPDKTYLPWIERAFDFIESTDADIVILDEFADLVPDYVSLEKALAILKDNKEYIITGHKPLPELIEKADYVTCFKKEKHPYDNGIPARKGIEY